MKFFFISLFLISCASTKIKLSKSVYENVEFSSLYSKDGAVIKNINYQAVKDLKSLVEKKYATLLKGQKLKDRGEAHITIITPPEGKSNFFPNSVGLDKMISTEKLIKQYKEKIQNAKFEIKCLGKQQDQNGAIVFYLVVDSPDIIKMREEIYNSVKQSKINIPFKPREGYYPHITVGYIQDDIHGQSKGEDTCTDYF